MLGSFEEVEIQRLIFQRASFPERQQMIARLVAGTLRIDEELDEVGFVASPTVSLHNG